MKSAHCIFSLVALVIFSLSSCIKNDSNIVKQKNSKFYGRGSKVNNLSSQAAISFDYSVEFLENEIKEGLTKHDLESIVYRKIYYQIRHLFGSLHFQNEKGTILPPNYGKITYDLAQLQTSERTTFPYRFSGLALLDEEVGATMSLPIPRNPYTIYNTSLGNNEINPCTDSHYNSAGDFWYFWNPKLPDCNTIAEGKDYDTVKINVDKYPNTQKTYPEYYRLIKENKTVPIYLFLGYSFPNGFVDDNFMNIGSLNRDSFNYTKNKLLIMGFNQTSKKPRRTSSSFLYTFEKNDLKTGIKYIVNFFIGNTEFNEDSAKDHKDFSIVYKEALEQGALIYYAGHSGLGSYLNLDEIKRSAGEINIPKDSYQILFFNSCSSFSYYTYDYFRKKVNGLKTDGSIDSRGIYNLDIITNGLSSKTSINTHSFSTFLKIIINAFENKEFFSFQEIIDQLHNEQIKLSQGNEGHMLNVMGDTDNPTDPPSLD